MLLEHLAELAPPGQLVGTGVRVLKRPSGTGDYRGMAAFRWVPAVELAELEPSWQKFCTPALHRQWDWVHQTCAGPARAARHLNGVRLPAVPMVRPVTCTTPPLDDEGRQRGGCLDELAAVLGLSIDVDVAERRPGDHRRYCRTVDAARRFLRRYGPTVVLDTGGGLAAVWLFTEPAPPRQARQLGHDLKAAFERAAVARGWQFDSPPPHAAWLKVPGCADLLRQHVTVELDVGERWRFEQLRSAVPVTAWRPSRRYAEELTP